MTHTELCKEIGRLDDICDEIIASFDKKWFAIERVSEVGKEFMMNSFDEYNEKRQEACQPHLSNLIKLQREERFTKPYTLTELPKYGDVMSLDDFVENCECGGFINYDGYGRYVKNGKETNIEIYPSDVENKLIRTEFDTIIWFNR